MNRAEARELPSSLPSAHDHPERFVSELADAFERVGRDGTAAGLRVIARRVAECQCREAAEGGCKLCGGRIRQPVRGRRRVVCEDCRPSRAKLPANGRLPS